MRQQITADGVTFSVQVEGSGPPLVFVHGWSMSGRFFERQVDHFATARQVIVPDLRGHGESGKVLSGHTVARYAQDLHAILGELSVTRPVLAGWSMGAMVGYEYLRQQGPGSLAGLVVVDQPPSDFAWEGYEFGAFTLDGLREMNEQLQTDQLGLVTEFTQLMLHREDPATMAWMAAEIMRVPPVIASTILIDQSLRDYRDFLPQVDVPTLVLFGEDDKLTSPRAGEYIASRIPGAVLRTFANSSHCPFWEDAADFNAAIDEFLAALP